MNPDQIDALIQDLKDRAADHESRGNQEAADIYTVSARVVLEHFNDARRAAGR